MKKVLLIAALACFGLSTTTNAQTSEAWEQYKEARPKGEKTILPDFSYAGYKYSEEAIPNITGKVFDVTKFGAKPNDKKSDKKAIIKAIAAAEKNQGGIIFFPKGKYYLNTKKDEKDVILVRTSNIVFRGEGFNEEGSILYFDQDIPAADPKKLWTAPFAIKTSPRGADKVLTKVTKAAARETFEIEVENTNKIKVGDWVTLAVKNNSKDLIDYELSPTKADPKWKSILEKGVVVNERHQVKAIDGNTITFVEPIHYDVKTRHNWVIKSYNHLENVGFENLAFQGNWQESFVHHKDAVHDGGWSILNLNGLVNSWIQDCRFTDVSRSVHITKSAAFTALNCVITGNPGHNAISMSSSTGVLLAKCVDKASVWHSFGVSGGSATNNVIWRCEWPATTTFESHASQPRNTLLDCDKGGFFTGRAGGARQNLPNHLRNLVIWNFTETDQADDNFTFWAKDTWFWKVVPPIVVGFHNENGKTTTFDESSTQLVESNGKAVKTSSLFEAQLELRLGTLPEWINEVKEEKPL